MIPASVISPGRTQKVSLNTSTAFLKRALTNLYLLARSGCENRPSITIGSYWNNSPLYRAPRYPRLSYTTPFHAHSILSNHRNALIYKCKIFPLTVKTRPSSRQNSSLLISKGNSRGLDLARFHRLSTTIGQFFARSTIQDTTRRCEKRPSPFIAQDVRTHHALNVSPPSDLLPRPGDLMQGE